MKTQRYSVNMSGHIVEHKSGQFVHYEDLVVIRRQRDELLKMLEEISISSLWCASQSEYDGIMAGTYALIQRIEKEVEDGPAR